MAFPGSGPINDTIKYLFNVFTGNFSPAIKFNENRIVTSQLNSAGQPKVTWNAATNSYVPDGPDIVVSNEGDVIVVGN
jgi:hypothetical protein